MTKVIDSLPEGLQTKVSVLGAPLQPLEFLLLKLAAAIIGKPKLLILNQHFDAIPVELRARLLRRLSKHDFTVMYFTNMPLPDCFEGVLHLHDNATAMLNEYSKGESPVPSCKDGASSTASTNNKEGE